MCTATEYGIQNLQNEAQNRAQSLIAIPPV